jgi:hypothetical protein
MGIFTRIDEKHMIGIIEVLDDDDNESEVEIPIEFEVCGTCRGKGSRVNPAVDGHGLSREDFDEDPGFEEDYFAGVYDVTCSDCRGTRVEPIIADEDKLSDEQKAALKYAYNREQDRRDDERTMRMENGEW